jgi:hypothetical protein
MATGEIGAHLSIRSGAMSGVLRNLTGLGMIARARAT